MKTHLTNRELYLSYVNDFLTVDAFAEYYDMSRSQALSLINTERNK